MSATPTRRAAVVNIGALLTGDVQNPESDADHLIIEDGTIAQIGDARDLSGVDVVHDAGGMTVLPGLIDNHVHPVIGDYTPRQQQAGYLEGFVHGGVTSAVSAGEVHTPGRPKDRAGTKALAILAHKAFAGFRPSGLKLHAGALMLEPGLEKGDFDELAEQGVHLVGEIGISGVKDPAQAAEMTRWAQQAGMSVTVHVGGASVPTSRTVDGAFAVEVGPDVAAHVNGGPTAAAVADVERILAETRAAVEVVHNGNVRALVDVVRLVVERGELARLVVGTDSPAGSGVQPLGVLRTLSWISALGGVPAALAVAAATGNVARARGIGGGLLAIGQPADLVIADAPAGSQADDFSAAMEIGDTPAIAAVLVDGDVVVTRSRNTPPPGRTAVLS